MWAAASHRVGCTVDLYEVVIKQVRSLHSRVHSHLMHEVKGRLADSTIYGLGNLSGPEARAAQAEYLLKNDRFLSPAQHYETYRVRFLAPEIIDILYYKYVDGVRMRGVKDPEFLERITPTFICLISTAIWHGIRAWSTGTYVKPDHFQSQNENVVKTFNRMSHTWKERSMQNQEATLEVIKDNLREKIREKKGITIEVVHAQLRGIEAEEEGEENEEEQEEGDHEGGECFGGECFGEHWERFGGECFGEHWERCGGECFVEHWERFGGECFGEHWRVLWRTQASPLERIVECFGDGSTYIPILYSISEFKTEEEHCIARASGERAFRREGVRRKSIPSRGRQAKEHSVGIAPGERALRRGERITIGTREKPSIRLGALGTLVRARAECFAPERARSILLLLWRGSLSTERPGRPERPQCLVEAPGLLMRRVQTGPFI
ncbi:hypothetical protein DFP73DRAFT_597641 [Morchella snyderi]|nr:hypothetical protein DFP73DRAFT_597641 [Morchella snyderi]